MEAGNETTYRSGVKMKQSQSFFFLLRGEGRGNGCHQSDRLSTLSPTRFGGEVGNATQMMLSFLLINLN